jgi:hypothetical protein
MRRKSYTLAAVTPGQAAAEAELLDYDFHLFTEKSTGEDAVVYRSGTGYGLALAHSQPGRLAPIGPSIEVIPVPAPRLTVAEAVSWLAAVSEPFLFFRDAETGRGNVIYLRYDGQFGLIAPANRAPAPAARPRRLSRTAGRRSARAGANVPYSAGGSPLTRGPMVSAAWW